MSKHYACSSCGAFLEADELITVHNPEWVLKPVDDECCPHCKGLAVEVQDE
jgi:hypothetical protein